MLRIITGREGCGKTRRIMDEIASGESSILIVPEQYSHDAERMLCVLGGEDISLRAEVLSFTRLSNRVFSQAGGLAVQYLDACGRVLAMRLALDAAAPELKLFGLVPSRPEHLNNMLSMMDELRNYGVTPADLEKAAELTDGMLAKKLDELSLISDAYEAVTKNGLADPTERLKMLAYKLAECDYPVGKSFYIDCFTDFSKLELDVIDRLIADASTVTVCLTWDEDEIYHVQEHTIGLLQRIAQRHGVKYTIERLPEREKAHGELSYLDRNLFNYQARPFDGPCPALELAAAKDIEEECNWAAARCRRLMAENGARWQDIAIAATDLEAYRQRLVRAFEDFDIPLYQSHKEDVTKKPAIALICAALDTVTCGYDYEDIFAYLKSGYAGISAGECDILENYVITWNIHGSIWKRPFTYDPQGFGREVTQQSAARLEELEQLRRRVIEPLETLETRLNKAPTCGDMVLALYQLMTTIDLPGSLESRAARLDELGKSAQADECDKLWQIITNILDQAYSMLSPGAMSATEFARLIKIALATGDIGTIPVYFDAVTLSDLSRLRHRSVKWLIILGANDGMLPSMPASAGVLTEDERDTLLTLGLELAPSANERVERELGVIHCCIASAVEGVSMAYHEYSDGSEQVRPSMVISRIRTLFPSVNISRAGEEDRLWSRKTAFQLSFTANRPDIEAWLSAQPELYERRERLLELSKISLPNLSKQAATSLYGSRIRLSATRIDRFRGCKFSYFMEYGLRAEPRKAAQFSAPEYGTFMHYILEGMCAAAREHGDYKSFDRSRLPDLVEELTAQYIKTQLSGGLENKSQRFRYLFNRLKKNVLAVAENVFEELSCSDFQPLDFELAFGSDGALGPVQIHAEEGEGAISGKVDRVDGYILGDKLYLRVVDYKTGKKAFDFTDIRYGMGMQMLIYLFALGKEGSRYYGKEIVPAGVMYLPARDDILKTSRHISQEELKKLRDKALTRSGLLLDDERIIRAMEHSGEGYRFLPIKLNKDKQPSKDWLASSEQLGKLSRYVDKTLQSLTDELAGGSIPTDPYKSGENTPCRYCQYAAACGHDGAKFRYLKKYTTEKFWTELEREVD